MKNPIIKFSLFWLTAFSLILGAVNLPVQSSPLMQTGCGPTGSGCTIQSDSDSSNKAAGFDGGDYAGTGDGLERVDTDALDPSAAFTVGAWVWVDPSWEGTNAYIYKGGSAASGYILANSIHYGGDGTKMQFSIGNGARKDAFWGSAFSTSTWYFVVGQYDGTNVKISVNDGTYVTTAATTPVANAAKFQIGSDDGGVNQTHFGYIDSAFFAPSALDAATITALYNSGAGVKWCQLTTSQQALFNGWWELKEASGSARNDSTANAYNLSEHNTPSQVAGKTSGACVCP